MENQENQNQQQNFQNKKTNLVLIYFLVFLGIFFIFFLSFLLIFIKPFEKKQKPEQKENFSLISPTPSPLSEEPIEIKNTEVMINIFSPKRKYRSGEEIEIILEAKEIKENIVGYDIILSYDEKNLEYIKTQSLIEGFSIYPYKTENTIFLTGVKSPQIKEETIFKDKAFANLFFKAKNKGNYKIEILSNKNTSKTKFIDEKTQEFYPQSISIIIEVE